MLVHRIGMKTLTLILAAMAFVASANAEEDPIKVGQTIPDVVVQDLEGADVSLRAAVKEAPAVLIFYRGGWCPYCIKHLQASTGIDGH